MKITPVVDLIAIVATVVLVGNAASGCNGTSGTPSSPSSGSAPVGATLTLTADGVSDAAPRVALGSSVRFTNNDSVPHEIFSTPHGPHTDCPAMNEIGMLQPGQSGQSAAFTARRGCGFHDHLHPDDSRFRGQVIVGFADDDPDPAAPVY